MRSTHLVLVLALFSWPTVLAPSTASANIEYPWCAVYGGDMGGASNCGFTTIAQCMATVSGIGGSCEPNQFYHPQQAPVRKRKRPERH